MKVHIVVFICMVTKAIGSDIETYLVAVSKALRGASIRTVSESGDQMTPESF